MVFQNLTGPAKFSLALACCPWSFISPGWHQIGSDCYLQTMRHTLQYFVPALVAGDGVVLEVLREQLVQHSQQLCLHVDLVVLYLVTGDNSSGNYFS